MQAEAQRTRENTQPRQSCCWFASAAAAPGSFSSPIASARRFGPVFPHKRSRDWVLRSLFWLGQGKLGRGTRQHEKATSHSSLCQNDQQTSRWGYFCTYVRMIYLVRTNEKMLYFRSVFYFILMYPGLGISEIQKCFFVVPSG